MDYQQILYFSVGQSKDAHIVPITVRCSSKIWQYICRNQPDLIISRTATKGTLGRKKF
ncbi:uncharacterized protein LOC133848884 isoform X7 [Drosophila sulfurigaster albostrigata]|uniref:uncharacterized protein LOC133848884 isoform X7 n=1 Tax=Drosophila sulfurigaster albostrigata TaxID=89887 RepID=UPI002D219EBF|nr:uncharacterized protein LOC133848884 isoform X7 [Drosophila sulfurigaster albostrigata]